MFDNDADPELYSFNLRPVRRGDLAPDRGDHRLAITEPTWENPRLRSSQIFGLNTVELVDLRDTIDRYLEELRDEVIDLAARRLLPNQREERDG